MAENHLDRVWEIIEQVGVCMLTTRFAGGLRARPLEAGPIATRAPSGLWPTCAAARSWRLKLSTTSDSCSSKQRPTAISRLQRALRCRGDHAASKAVAAFEFIKAQLTGEKPNLPRIAKRR
jgi:hypothetical protein